MLRYNFILVHSCESCYSSILDISSCWFVYISYSFFNLLLLRKNFEAVTKIYHSIACCELDLFEQLPHFRYLLRHKMY